MTHPQIKSLKRTLHSATRGTVFFELSKGRSLPDSLIPHKKPPLLPHTEPQTSSLAQVLFPAVGSLEKRRQASLHYDTTSAYPGPDPKFDSHFLLVCPQRKVSRFSRGRLTPSILPIRCETENDGFPRLLFRVMGFTSAPWCTERRQAPGARGILVDRRGDCAW